MINIEDLEKWKTIDEMKIYWETIKAETLCDEAVIKMARLKLKGTHYKELLEEYVPLIHFLELKYKGHKIECKYTGLRTQRESEKYDAEILIDNNIKEKIEITTPRFGEFEKMSAIQLNKNGYTCVEIGDLRKRWECIKEYILKTANKKAYKEYSDVILVIYFEYLMYYYQDCNIVKTYLDEIVNSLREINYTAKEVYFLIPPFDSSNGTFNGDLYKVK